MPRRLSPVPDVGEVTRQSARDDEQCVDPDIVAFPGIARRQPFCGHRDTAKAIFIKRPCGRVLRGALLYLDECERPAAPGNQIDLSAGNAGAPANDAPAFEAQPPGGNGFSLAAPRFGDLAVQSLPANSRALA